MECRVSGLHGWRDVRPPARFYGRSAGWLRASSTLASSTLISIMIRPILSLCVADADRFGRIGWEGAQAQHQLPQLHTPFNSFLSPRNQKRRNASPGLSLQATLPSTHLPPQYSSRYAPLGTPRPCDVLPMLWGLLYSPGGKRNKAMEQRISGLLVALTKPGLLRVRLHHPGSQKTPGFASL
jgi:hypothetical protein